MTDDSASPLRAPGLEQVPPGKVVEVEFFGV
jgi:hypothetical protein